MQYGGQCPAMENGNGTMGLQILIWEGRLEEECATVETNPIMVDCHIFDRPSSFMKRFYNL